MRYLTTLTIIAPRERRAKVQEILQRCGFEVQQNSVIRVRLAKGDKARQKIVEQLRAVGQNVFTGYEPDFEAWEVEAAELLHLFVRDQLGGAFTLWAKELSLPEGTRVIDKAELEGKDIALTSAFEVLISGRVKDLLRREGLTGWEAFPIVHIDPTADNFKQYYHLISTSMLPPLASETELRPLADEKLGDKREIKDSMGFVQEGPLVYRRAELSMFTDFNRTRELFGDAPIAHPLLIVTQRAWRTLHDNNLGRLEVEPVMVTTDRLRK